MPEYFLEIRSQELPARQARRGIEWLAGRLFEDLMGLGLAPAEIVTGTTRRRLAVGLVGLPEAGPDRVVQELGPPLQEARDEAGEPSEALLGFAERVGRGVDELETIRTERGEYVAVEQLEAGVSAVAALTRMLPRILTELRWKGNDRWRPIPGAWPSPVVGLTSVFDGSLLPLTLEGVEATVETVGHPVFSPTAFEVSGFESYRDQLLQRGLVVSWRDRREILEERLHEEATAARGEMLAGEALLDALTARCEIPGVVRATFDPEFLSLPEEVILVFLEEHGAVALRGREGLLPSFLAVMDRADDPEGTIAAGHGRAVAGHLADARYHLEADLRLTLVERARQLELVVFHPRLGSWATKVERIRQLLELLCDELGWEDEKETVLQAAALAKADLISELVRELPRLRGTLGAVYARREGYGEGVWQAIADHYRPAGSSEIPRQRSGRLLAVADRLDTLVGFLGIGEGPRAGRDPMALRRLAVGLLRILIEGEIPLDLEMVAARAVLLYGDTLEREAADLLADLMALLDDRLTYLLGQRGFHFDEIEAGVAVGRKNLPDLVSRLEALREARGQVEFRSLVLSAKRISNLVDGVPEYEIVPDLLEDEAEIALAEQLAIVRPRVDEAAAARHYGECLERIQDLVPALERFFADVLVMDENQRRRENRLALLQACRRVFWKVARLKAVGGDRGEGS